MATPVEIVTLYLASFAGGDPDVIAGFVSPDFQNDHLSALGAGSAGRSEYLRRLPGFLESFADRRYAVDQIVEQRSANGSEVVVRYRFTATHDGRPIEIPGVMWFVVSDDAITRRIDVWDSLTFLEQTGQR